MMPATDQMEMVAAASGPSTPSAGTAAATSGRSGHCN